MKIKYSQFAKDYDFINAWKIFPDHEVDSTVIDAYVTNSKFEELCFECFLDVDGRSVVIGWSNGETEAVKFIKESLSFIQNPANTDDFIENVRSDVPDMIRVGVIDYWYETGPCLLWEYGEKESMNRARINERLSKYPQISHTDLNPQGLSYYFSDKRFTQEHWLMIDVSKKVGDLYEIDLDKILTALEEI